jgi:hypothetical protein
MSPTKSMLALLFALGSTGALAQDQATQTPVPPKPANSPTYGPVLNPQAAPATTQQGATTGTGAAGETRPQAQEERAGQPPTTGRHNQVDPSARPAAEEGQAGAAPSGCGPAHRQHAAHRRPGAGAIPARGNPAGAIVRPAIDAGDGLHGQHLHRRQRRHLQRRRAGQYRRQQQRPPVHPQRRDDAVSLSRKG